MNVRQHLILGLDELCFVGTVKEGCSHYKKKGNTVDESYSQYRGHLSLLRICLICLVLFKVSEITHA